MGYIIKLQDKAVEDIKALKKAGEKATINKIHKLLPQKHDKGRT